MSDVEGWKCLSGTIFDTFAIGFKFGAFGCINADVKSIAELRPVRGK